MSDFITIEVVSFTPEQRGQPSPEFPQGEVVAPAKHNTFDMYVRPEHIAATNIVEEGPTESVNSIVYFSSESALKPVLSTASPEDVVQAADDGLSF